MITLLGIDPGSRITGYGVIQMQGRRLHYLGSGCIRITAEPLPLRLKQVFDGITEVIRQFQPDEIAIENVFLAKNADSALKLGQARGAAIVAACNSEIPVSEYAARLVKKAVVGTGSADKKQMQHMVTQILKLPGTPQEDAADALGIAICHAHSRQQMISMAGSNRLPKNARFSRR